MDHRISKDMISSGMIPSGEKNQEDLSRTQYGTAPSPNALSDVYKKMYEHHKKDADGNTIPHEGEELNEFAVTGTMAALKGLGAAAKTSAIRTGIKVGGKTGGKFVKGAIDKPLQTAANVSSASNMMPRTSSGKDGIKKTSSISAGADLFDIVKGQLLDEGLTEEEIKDIMLTLTPDEILKEIEESSMSDGSAGGAYQDLGPQGGFRSKEQINRMHNDPKGTEKYGKKLMKRVGQAVRDTGTPTVRKVDESKK